MGYQPLKLFFGLIKKT